MHAITFSIQGSNPDNTATDVCIPQSYSGSVCREVLQTRQNCLPDRNNTYDVIIAANAGSSQRAKDKQVCQLLGLFESVAASPECMKAAIAFLCSYTFTLCDSRRRPYRLSSAECSETVDSTCAKGLPEKHLPNCQVLSEASLECNGKDRFTCFYSIYQVCQFNATAD